MRAPVNFRKHVAEFKFIDDRYALCPADPADEHQSSSIFAFESAAPNAIPGAVIDSAMKRNVAYHATWTEGAERKLQFEELSYKAKDGEVFLLKEPEQEKEIVGPILELSGTKVRTRRAALSVVTSMFLLHTSTILLTHRFHHRCTSARTTRRLSSLARSLRVRLT